MILLLDQHKHGLSLAQIPILLRKHYNKTYNIQALGYPKLKNLLCSMEEVTLEKAQGTFLKAQLKKHLRKFGDSYVNPTNAVNAPVNVNHNFNVNMASFGKGHIQNAGHHHQDSTNILNQITSNDQVTCKRQPHREKKFFSLKAGGNALDHKINNQAFFNSNHNAGYPVTDYNNHQVSFCHF